jgi:hypothetical protein
MIALRAMHPAVFSFLVVCVAAPSAVAQESTTEVGTDIDALYKDEVALLYKT